MIYHVRKGKHAGKLGIYVLTVLTTGGGGDTVNLIIQKLCILSNMIHVAMRKCFSRVELIVLG